LVVPVHVDDHLGLPGALDERQGLASSTAVVAVIRPDWPVPKESQL
jgi:hypothetical protein